MKKRKLSGKICAHERHAEPDEAKHFRRIYFTRKKLCIPRKIEVKY